MMNFNKETLVIIPVRIGSTRLAEKALLDIGGVPMVVRVAKKALDSGLENVYIATDSEKIANVLDEAKVNYVYTDPSCPSGTDRVYQAWQTLSNKEDFKYILNVQGDMPFIESSTIYKVANSLWHSNADILTPVVNVGFKAAEGESNVKVVATIDNKALYFSRSMIPNSSENFLYHVGVYGFKAESLRKFVELPVSFLEKTERLEQLRALENGMSIGLCYVDTIPISVDTKEDYNKAIEYYMSS